MCTQGQWFKNKKTDRDSFIWAIPIVIYRDKAYHNWSPFYIGKKATDNTFVKLAEFYKIKNSQCLNNYKVNQLRFGYQMSSLDIQGWDQRALYMHYLFIYFFKFHKGL